MTAMFKTVGRAERAATGAMGQVAIPLLRWSLGITYLWFGALKIAGKSPVAGLVSRTLPILPRDLVVRGLGVWEVAVGLGLLFRVALRPTLLLFGVQLVGTFLTFVVRPRETFQQGNPLLLTETGEFVLKNVVLLAAGIAVGSSIGKEHEAVSATDVP